MFFPHLAENCELGKLTDLLEQLDLSELVGEISRRRQGRGRKDWPVEAMLNSVYAMDILQHRSVSGFIRELRRNPSLMLVLGFKVRKSCRTDPTGGGYAVL